MSAFAAKPVEPLRYSAAIAAIAAVHFALAHFGPPWAVIQGVALAVWVPSGLALAVLLGFGLRYWPGIFIGALAANLVTGAPLATAAGIALGNTLEGVVGAALLEWTGFDRRLIRVADALRLIVVGGVVAPIVAATNGTAQICLAGLAPWSNYMAIWVAWWLGDGLRMIVVTPFLLTWVVKMPRWPSPREVAEAAAVGIVIAGTIGLAFWGIGDGVSHPALTYAAFPAVLFATVRFGVRGATASVILAAALAIGVGTELPSLFAAGSLADGLAVLKVFTGSLAISSLVLAAALAEREHAVAALRMSEAEASQARARLADAVESLSDHFILYDADDRVVLMNRVAREWHPDFAASVGPGTHMTDVIRAAARTGLMGNVGEDIEDIVRDRMAVHRKNYGTVLERLIGGRWLQVREFPTSDGSVVVLRTDVTARKQQEAALLEARSQLEDSIEALSDGFALYGADDRLVLCNAKYKEVYAVSADLLVPGARFEDIIREGAKRGQYADAMGRVDAYVAERMQNHLNPTGVIEQKLSDGRWLRIAERRTRSGGLAGIRTDITELKTAMTALQDSEQKASRAHARLIDAIESLDDGFLLWDADDRLILFNRAIKEMVPEQGDFLIPGISFADLINRRVHSGQIIEAIGREETFIRDRIGQHRKSDGESVEQHFADGRWARIRERRTREGGVVMIRTDISTLKRREAELIAARSNAIEASRTKSEFLAMMSHELRTPLNVVIGFAEILRNQGSRLDAKKVMDYAGDVYEAGRHLLELLNDVLDLSKAEAGKMELQLGPVDVADVIGRSLRMIRERATRRQIAVIDRSEPDLPILEADERKLIQILLNLLSNAVKFTPEGGEVAVAAWRDGPHRLTIEVTDTGIGIAPENIETALTAFGQVHNLLTREQAGTGLGLPLAKRLVELHGGTLKLHSVLGAGTTVTLHFPVIQANSTAVA